MSGEAALAPRRTKPKPFLPLCKTQVRALERLKNKVTLLEGHSSTVLISYITVDVSKNYTQERFLSQ